LKAGGKGMRVINNEGEEVYVFKGERLLFLGTLEKYLNYIRSNEMLYSYFGSYGIDKVVTGKAEVVHCDQGLIDVSDRIKLKLDDRYCVTRFYDYTVVINER
jgi:hypothetical protein